MSCIIRWSQDPHALNPTQIALSDCVRCEGIGLLFGVLLALPGSLALTKFFSHVPFRLDMFDSVSYAIAAALLFAVAILAMYIPAWRAAKVDPMVALRYE